MDLNKNKHDVTAWVNDYSDILYAYVVQRVRDSDTARDLLQDTFLAAWRNVDKYNGDASVKTWLFTILKNKVIDHYRKLSNKYTEEIVTEETDTDEFFNTNDYWVERAYPSEWGKTNVESKEFFEVLQRGIKKLKEIQAAVFSMKYLDDMESEEICKVLNISASNYWVLIHRAKVQLRSYIESNW
ncbi:MAG: sigma-70 family RNA polymerase sigma factor [Ferruginibacter sp.]